MSEDTKEKRIFISWSGERSRKVAEALREWFLSYFFVESFVSAEDIPKGSQWLREIMSNLESSFFGISVVTPENQLAPWLNFEAGALVLKMDRRVAPYCVGMPVTDLTGPLSTLQATRADEDDTRRLVLSIGTELGHDWGRAFERSWPELEQVLDELPVPDATSRLPQRSDTDKIDELLRLVRGLTRSSVPAPDFRTSMRAHRGTLEALKRLGLSRPKEFAQAMEESRRSTERFHDALQKLVDEADKAEVPDLTE